MSVIEQLPKRLEIIQFGVNPFPSQELIYPSPFDTSIVVSDLLEKTGILSTNNTQPQMRNSFEKWVDLVASDIANCVDGFITEKIKMIDRAEISRLMKGAYLRTYDPIKLLHKFHSTQVGWLASVGIQVEERYGDGPRYVVGNRFYFPQRARTEVRDYNMFLRGIRKR